MNVAKMFAQKTPTQEQERRMNSVGHFARRLALEIQTSTPAGSNQTLAIRHVEDALTRANKAILEGPDERPEQAWTIYVDLEDEGRYLIQKGELFREEPGGTYTPIGRVETLTPQRGPERVKATGILPVPMAEERKRRELALAELMTETIEEILGDKTIGWEAAARLVKAIKHAYPELLDPSL